MLNKVLKLVVLLASFMAVFASAQWGAIKPPPCNSCGNHYPADHPANHEGCVNCAEAKDDKAASQYGQYRAYAEAKYETLDAQDK